MIPRTMHHIWIGPDRLPEQYAEYRAGWRSMHPDWVHYDWGNDVRTVLHDDPAIAELWERAPEIAPGSVEQFRSDLLRYVLLYRFGGVYVDADMEPRKPIDSLLEDVGCFAAWEDTDVWINNAIMGAIPFHPFVGELIRRLPWQVAAGAGRGWRPNKISGPQFLTGLWRKEPGGVTVFPKAYFYPYLWNELEREGEPFAEAYAVHHWNNAKRRQGIAV